MSRPLEKRRVRYLLLLVPHLGFLAIWDLAARIPMTLVCFAVALAALTWARRSWPTASLHGFLLIALVLRLLVVPLPPTLSDDVLRYVWDGKVAGSGFNPYVLPPDAPELADLRDGDWQALPHRDVATVYPPLALTFFSIAARIDAPILAWKLFLVAVDLMTCLLLYQLASAGTGDPRRAVWYAWNPLVTLEVAGMGHVDALGICAVVITVWVLATGRKTALAGVSAAAGVLAKLVPVLCYPAWWRHVRRRWLFAGVTALALGGALGPVALASGGVPSGYLRFGQSWEFNGPIYEPLWRVLEGADSHGRVELALEGLKDRTGKHRFWNRLYPYNYPRMHARVLLAGLFATLVVLAWRRTDVIVATGLVFEAVLVCSATVYPWYLLWLLPLAALSERPAWLVLCCMAFFSYVAQFTEISLVPWVFVACWGPYVVLRGPGRRWFAA